MIEESANNEKDEELQKQMALSVKVTDKTIKSLEEVLNIYKGNIEHCEKLITDFFEQKRQDSIFLAERDAKLEKFNSVVVSDTSYGEDGKQVITSAVMDPDAEKGGEIGDYIDDGHKDNLPYAKEIEIDGKVVFLLHLAFPSGTAEMSSEARNLLQEKFKELYSDKKGKKPIKSIEIYGHSDLENASESANFESDGYCASTSVATNTNECLGLTRAQKVKVEMDNFIAKNKEYVPENLAGKVKKVIYDDHFLLGGVDKILGNELIKGLGYQNRVKGCLKWLDINNPATSQQIESYRKNREIQSKIRTNQKQFRALSEPFRSVVVIIHYEET